MKTRVTTILLLLLLIFVDRTNACGPFDRMYLAKDYYMFRACGNNMSGDDISLSADNGDKRHENCQLWANLTSRSIPLADIDAVVYQWEMGNIIAMDEATHGTTDGYETDNQFAKWIVDHRDAEISEFLRLAKRNEIARSETTDPWYYAVECDDVSSELQDIVSQAKAYKGDRLRDRYVLQMVRAPDFDSHLEYEINAIDF